MARYGLCDARADVVRLLWFGLDVEDFVDDRNCADENGFGSRKPPLVERNANGILDFCSWNDGWIVRNRSKINSVVVEDTI